jgi:hypothetical protein
MRCQTLQLHTAEWPFSAAPVLFGTKQSVAVLSAHCSCRPVVLPQQLRKLTRANCSASWKYTLLSARIALHAHTHKDTAHSSMVQGSASADEAELQ